MYVSKSEDLEHIYNSLSGPATVCISHFSLLFLKSINHSLLSAHQVQHISLFLMQAILLYPCGSLLKPTASLFVDILFYSRNSVLKMCPTFHSIHIPHSNSTHIVFLLLNPTHLSCCIYSFSCKHHYFPPPCKEPLSSMRSCTSWSPFFCYIHVFFSVLSCTSRSLSCIYSGPFVHPLNLVLSYVCAIYVLLLPNCNC